METLTYNNFELIFRSAAFYRLLYTLYSVTKEKNPEVLGLVENELLENMLTHMKEYKKARSRLPTTDMKQVENAITKIIKYYKLFPEIKSKIDLCCAIQLTGSSLYNNSAKNDSSRTNELLDMNAKFHMISLHISDFSETVDANAREYDDITKLENLRPNNQYLSISIKIKKAL
jgi:hypothetical protein